MQSKKICFIERLQDPVSHCLPNVCEQTVVCLRMQAALAMLLAMLFINLGHVAEAFLTPTMERVSTSLRVPPRLAGVTLVRPSAPVLPFAALQTHGHIAFFAVLGST